MSDPVRELLVDAQAMETQGNKARAAELLLKAATLYERSGRMARAEQMRRHVARLTLGAPSAVKEPVGSTAAVPECIGQKEAMQALELAFGSEMKWLLLMGPEGSGKTTYLQQLSRAGRGIYLRTASEVTRAVNHPFLLLDSDPSDEAALHQAWRAASKGVARQILVAIRANPPKWTWVMKRPDACLPLYSTQELMNAAPGLPLDLAQQVQFATGFLPLGRNELEQIALAWLQARNLQVDRAAAAKAAAAIAASSGRGAHELLTVLRRIPAGPWAFQKRKRT